MTGIDDPYEAPLEPEFRFVPEDGTPDVVAARLIASL
jgi:adenylylsulfate kinase-like enzyme